MWLATFLRASLPYSPLLWGSCWNETALRTPVERSRYEACSYSKLHVVSRIINPQPRLTDSSSLAIDCSKSQTSQSFAHIKRSIINASLLALNSQQRTLILASRPR
jgi:hypothetical protein